MKYRAHINLALVVGTGAVIAAASNASPAIPKLTPEIAIFCILSGAGMVDIDILFVRGGGKTSANGGIGCGHRVKSKMHWLESPLFFMLCGSVAWNCGQKLAGSLLFWFALGWFLHLLGDFIQGGIMCRTIKKRVGFKSFSWSLYNDTALGLCVHFLLGVLALVALVAFTTLFMKYPDSFLFGTALPQFVVTGLFREVLAGRTVTTPLMYIGVYLFFIVGRSFGTCIAKSIVASGLFLYWTSVR